MKNTNDTIGDRTHDLPTCSAVPQPNALPRAPIYIYIYIYIHKTYSGSYANYPNLLESVIRITVLTILVHYLIMPAAAWDWGSNNSVVNNVLAETGSMLVAVGLPPVSGSMICGRMFSEGFAGSSLYGDSEKYE